MKRRILSMLLVLMMLLTIMPTAAFADKSSTDVAYKVEGGNIYFDKSTGAITDCDETVTEARIPNKIEEVAVTSVGKAAFEFCKSLTSITLPNSVTSIEYGTFSGCSSLTSINVASSNSTYSSDNGALFDKNKRIIIQYPAGKRDASYVIPNSVKSIGGEAFYLCESLQKITLPNSVTSIGDYAFTACSGLTSINIPNSVKSIGDGVFYGCTSLKK